MDVAGMEGRKHEHAQCLQHLQHLQDCLLGQCTQLDVQTSKHLSALTASVHSLVQQAADKDIDAARLAAQVQALQCQVASKQAESARLASDLARLRLLLQHQGPIDASTSSPAQPPQHQHRQELLASWAPASSKPTADIQRLQAELEARNERIAALEEEAIKAASDHNLRLAQVQEGCLCKLEQLRQLHKQQLDAAAADAQAHGCDVERLKQCCSQQEAVIEALRADVVAAAHKATEQQGEVLQLRQQLEQLKARHVQAAEAVTTGTHPTAPPVPAVAQSQQPACTAAPDDAGSSMLQLMEDQLARLSGIIRARDAEVAGLQQALAAACEERRQLQLQLTSSQLASTHLVQASPKAAKQDQGAPGAHGSNTAGRLSIAKGSHRAGMT